jgi:hypothetical protein
MSEISYIQSRYNDFIVVVLAVAIMQIESIYINRWVGHVARIGKIRNSNKILVGLKLPVRISHRKEDNIKTYRKEMGYENLDWIRQFQDRVNDGF